MSDLIKPNDDKNDDDFAPEYEETDTPGVYVTTVVPLTQAESTEYGIAYEDMTPEQKVEYGFVPCADWRQNIKRDDDDD